MVDSDQERTKNNLTHMKKEYILSLFTLGLIIIGCQRDNEIKLSEIIIGDYNDMIINTYDTILEGHYNSPRYYNIDLDNNGIDDIQFESEVWGSPGLGDHPKSSIKSLHDEALIYGFHSYDTCFLNIDTLISHGAFNSVDIGIYFNRTCHRITNIDSIIRITESYKVIPLNSEESIEISDAFNADTITLVDDPYQYPWSLIKENDDTTIYSIYNFYNDCNEFPLDEIKYIGIKLENDSKLGWIKVCLVENDKILILESGIQQ